MRRRTSLPLENANRGSARAGAERTGVDEVGRDDVRLIEAWERTLPADDQAVLAALAEADRLTDLDR